VPAILNARDVFRTQRQTFLPWQIYPSSPFLFFSQETRESIPFFSSNCFIEDANEDLKPHHWRHSAEFARSICEIQDAKVQNPESGDEPEETMQMRDDRSAKIAKDGKPNTSGHLDDLQKVRAKVGHEHHRRTGTLDKIRDVVL